MWGYFYQSLKSAVYHLLPPACLHCGNNLQYNDDLQLCDECTGAIEPLQPGHCSCCAHPHVSATSYHLCGYCLKNPPCFTKVYAACRYHGTIKETIQRLKYRNHLLLAKPLGYLLYESIAKQSTAFVPDIIIPVPLHINRLRQRSYNQALEIARPVSKKCSIPLDVSSLTRCRPTIPQQGLSADERKQNLKNAFRVSSPTSISGSRVLLIDDVITTGETVRACSKALIDAGASEVRAAAVGRA